MSQVDDQYYRLRFFVRLSFYQIRIMTLSSLLCSDKQLTVDVAVVQNAKTRYDGLLLFDNRSCIALCKALRKAGCSSHFREGDEILKSFIYRQRATYFPN